MFLYARPLRQLGLDFLTQTLIIKLKHEEKGVTGMNSFFTISGIQKETFFLVVRTLSLRILGVP